MRNERILLADDSASFRGAVADKFTLFRSGHQVVAQAGSLDDIRKILNQKVDFTVAIIDGTMEREGDGKEAAELIRKRYPSVKIVALSNDDQDWGDLNLLKSIRGADLIAQIDSL